MLALPQIQSFTIGICASDTAENLPRLIELIQSERFPEDYLLERIVMVASGCSKSTLEIARAFARSDLRVILFEESIRKGKAGAVNKIIQNSAGSYLVFINSDALPDKGSIFRLLSAIEKDETIGLVSGHPSFSKQSSATSLVEQLMWNVHNECSFRLNHMNESNHGSDEMMVVRTDLLQKLPMGLVNDGAYIAGRARLRGYSIKFCPEATVQIDVPARTIDLIRQRQRIIFGHFQVWRLTGRSPKTVESLLLSSPFFSLAIVVRTVAGTPKFIKAIPLAFIVEVVSIIRGLKDAVSSTKKHGVWERYGN
ncbi:MAG TPA: glycosyltransferase [Nitrososphaerales archaeon]|nr:glycosyltransferase [Nitrososphaerales archaeon]